MGTLFRIKLYAAEEAQARTAFRAAFDRIAELDATLSDYKPESELNRVCRAPGSAKRYLSAKICSAFSPRRKTSRARATAHST